MILILLTGLAYIVLTPSYDSSIRNTMQRSTSSNSCDSAMMLWTHVSRLLCSSNIPLASWRRICIQQTPQCINHVKLRMTVPDEPVSVRFQWFQCMLFCNQFSVRILIRSRVVWLSETNDKIKLQWSWRCSKFARDTCIKLNEARFFIMMELYNPLHGFLCEWRSQRKIVPLIVELKTNNFYLAMVKWRLQSKRNTYVAY